MKLKELTCTGHRLVDAHRQTGLSRETVLKMCRFSLPPGYTRTAPVANIKPRCT